jgi:hypothetical protein
MPLFAPICQCQEEPCYIQHYSGNVQHEEIEYEEIPSNTTAMIASRAMFTPSSSSSGAFLAVWA